MVILDLKFDAFAVRFASPDATPALVEPILLDEQEPDVTLTLPTSSMPSHCPARTPTMALVITMIVKAKAKKFYSKIPSILFLFSVYICFHSLVSIYHIYLAFFIYFARKSIVAKCAITKGDYFTEENLTVKRPGTGISPMKWYEVLGMQATRDYEADELI